MALQKLWHKTKKTWKIEKINSIVSNWGDKNCIFVRIGKRVDNNMKYFYFSKMPYF